MARTKEEIEAARAARKAELETQREAQELVDLEALDAAELQLGDSSVCHVDVPFTPGLPTKAIARCPKPVEIKRFQDMAAKTKRDGNVSTAGAVAALGALVAVVRVYPDAETFARMVEARPMLDLDLGNAALGLAKGSAADEGKD
jgi:hypothetical protein